MGSRMKQARGAMALAEMKEFAGFSAGTQRYVRRALDIGLDREDALARWSRDVVEAARIRAQARLYDRLPDLRVMIPDDSGLGAVEPRSEGHTSELQSLMRSPYAVFCLKKKTKEET